VGLAGEGPRPIGDRGRGPMTRRPGLFGSEEALASGMTRGPVLPRRGASSAGSTSFVRGPTGGGITYDTLRATDALGIAPCCQAAQRTRQNL
jgi:hypothetical protein